LQLKALSLDGNTATNITCNGVANGTATVTVSGGISPYTYTWSGANTSTVSNLGPGQYDVVVTDVLNNKVTANFTITETLITIPSAVESTVYYGYASQSCTTLSADVTGGVHTPTNGATEQPLKNITVCQQLQLLIL
jgi:hypothetical protein